MKKFLAPVIVSTAALLLFGCGETASTEAAGGTVEAATAKEERRPAPEFALKDADGKEYKLSDYKGKVVLLNFWATWCVPCIEEMPSLQTLHEELEESGLHIMAVSVDTSPDLAFTFAQENDLTLHMLFDRKQAAANAYQVRTIPITFLIDRDGKIVSKVRGTRDWTSSEMKDQIQDVLRNRS